MSQLVMFAVDVAAALILVFALYFPRHRRRDLVVALLGVNVGVLVVSATLATSTVGAGLGLGLFGVLSIIRLRSTELSQTEVAYYFAALAFGLLGGLGLTTPRISIAGILLILVVVGLADHPRVLRKQRSQLVVLDRTFTDESGLVAYLEQLLGGRVHGVNVQRLDLVNDSMVVDVRYCSESPTGSRSNPRQQREPAPLASA